MRRKKSIIVLILLVVLSISTFGGCLSAGSDAPSSATTDQNAGESQQTSADDPSGEKTDINSGSTAEADISEDGQYNTKDEVALYIKTYGHLPSNYVTKKDARKAGWHGGSLERYFPGCSLGGDVFKNREGLLPKVSGRAYYECDVDSSGRDSRGANRIVYSNDGLIYFSNDHYRSFELLYGSEGSSSSAANQNDGGSEWEDSRDDYSDDKSYDESDEESYEGSDDKSYEESDVNSGSTAEADISEDGQYESKDEVALYIKKFGHLPSNYLTKKAAREAGWHGGPLENYLPGHRIGGDVFKNREGLLPKAPGRTYYECDVNSSGRNSRGASRIVYSNDGLIYFSNDHYRSFKLLYGKEN